MTCSDISLSGYGGGRVARRCSFRFFRPLKNRNRKIAEARRTTPPTAPPAIAPMGVPLPLDSDAVDDASSGGSGLCVGVWVTVRVTVFPFEVDWIVPSTVNDIAGVLGIWVVAGVVAGVVLGAVVIVVACVVNCDAGCVVGCVVAGIVVGVAGSSLGELEDVGIWPDGHPLLAQASTEQQPRNWGTAQT